jgi:hypothetical protein
MAKYFNYFPKALYSSNTKTSGLDEITNITARFGFEQALKENSSAFYKYDLQEGDTPEIVAAKFYDSPERHWIVLMFNDIYDPQYDWPLQYSTFIEYVDKKYSANNYADTANTSVTGLSWAMNVNNVHAYYKVITRTNIDDISITEKIEVDANTWANVASSTTNFVLQDGSTITQTITKEKQSYYDYENELNESKRSIKLLKPEFVSAVEKEFKKVIRQ